MSTVSAHCLACGVNDRFMILMTVYSSLGRELFAMVCHAHRDDKGVLGLGWRGVVEVRTR